MCAGPRVLANVLKRLESLAFAAIVDLAWKAREIVTAMKIVRKGSCVLVAQALTLAGRLTSMCASQSVQLHQEIQTSACCVDLVSRERAIAMEPVIVLLDWPVERMLATTLGLLRT